MTYTVTSASGWLHGYRSSILTRAMTAGPAKSGCNCWVPTAGSNTVCLQGKDGALGGALPKLDSRALVILRETLAFHSPLADFAFAMQGLGSGAITLAGTPAQQAAYLPLVASGEEDRSLCTKRARRWFGRWRHVDQCHQDWRRVGH
jgi:hypothetical protein